MGFFNSYQKEGKGVTKGQSSPRFILFFQIFFRKFWSFVVINMMYLLSCIPILTIGPATAGVTKLLRNYAREEHAFVWGDYIDTIKKNWKQALAYSLLDFAVSALFYFNIVLFPHLPTGIVGTLSMAATYVALTIWTFMRYYIYPMMITFRLSFKQLLKNAFIFCWVGFFRNFLLTFLLIAMSFFGLLYLQWYAIFVFLTVYPAFCGFLINFTVYPLIKKHMIDGFDPETGEKLDEEKYEGFEDEYEQDELDEFDDEEK